MTLRFEDLAEGVELPGTSRLVTREDVAAYAEASGDRNPLHLDDAVGRAAGFPGVIAHGMYTMGTLASWLVGLVGDPAALARLRVAFRAPVFPGDELECGGTVRSLDAGTRTAVLDVWARVERPDGTEWPIRKSEAVVRFG